MGSHMVVNYILLIIQNLDLWQTQNIRHIHLQNLVKTQTLWKETQTYT